VAVPILAFQQAWIPRKLYWKAELAGAQWQEQPASRVSAQARLQV